MGDAPSTTRAPPTKEQRLTKDQRQTLQELLDSDAPTWIEQNFYIPDPRDPLTGKLLPPGPIRLQPLQKRILRAALTKINGTFPYVTILYSTIKKSGKTRVGAAVACWFAATQGMYNEIYCMANDGKQSSDRILSAVKQCVKLNPQMRGVWRVTQTKVTLPNGTFIEAVPCDPTGQAGANPGLTVWSEMWGYRHEHKERLWSEMTIPPTRYGHALRWVESYAGYEGESNVLYDLYELGTRYARKHPAFLNPRLPININDTAQMFCYWDSGDEARRMPWQTPEYYQQEAAILTTAEFDRLHRNMWISPVNEAIPIEWWDACKATIPPLDSRTPVVMGVDAAVNGACCACSLVSRHPNPKLAATHTMIRAVRVWAPPEGGSIDLTATIEATIREWTTAYNLVEVAYDEYQLHKMVGDMRREGKVRFLKFGQVTPRYVADKQLYDMVVHKEIFHSGHQVLREHVENARAKTTGEKFRFVAPDAGTTGRARHYRPIDALVATSMANHECLRLNIAR